MGLFGGGGSSRTSYRIPKDFKEAFVPFRDYSIEAFNQLQEIGPYSGPWVAGIQQEQEQALTGLENLANARMANNPAQPVLAAAGRYFDPNYLDVGNDPIFNSALTAALRPMEEARAGQLNRARAVAAGSGADMSDRAFLLEDQINTDVNRAIGDTAAQAAFSELGRREQLQTTTAPQLYAGALGLEETPARLLGEVGDTRRQLEQETVVDPQKQAFEEQIASILRPQTAMQGFFGTTGLPFNSRNTGGGGGGGGMGSILSLVLGLAGLGMG
jgi:hypothetical protein